MSLKVAQVRTSQPSSRMFGAAFALVARAAPFFRALESFAGVGNGIRSVLGSPPAPSPVPVLLQPRRLDDRLFRALR